MTKREKLARLFNVYNFEQIESPFPGVGCYLAPTGQILWLGKKGSLRTGYNFETSLPCSEYADALIEKGVRERILSLDSVPESKQERLQQQAYRRAMLLWLAEGGEV